MDLLAHLQVQITCILTRHFGLEILSRGGLQLVAAREDDARLLATAAALGAARKSER